MRRSQILSNATWAVFALCALTLAGCAEPPQAEIDAVKTALEAARTTGAGEYAPEALQQAEAAQAKLDAELQAQQEKFALMRSYDTATTLAAEAKAAAENAATTANANREAAKQESSALIAETATLIEETKALLASAPKGKGSAADLKALEGDIAAIEQSVVDTQAAYDAGNYLQAKSLAQAAKDGINRVKDAINQAIEMSKGRRR